MTARDDYLAELGTWHLDANDEAVLCNHCGRVATWEHVDDGRYACADHRTSRTSHGWRRIDGAA